MSSNIQVQRICQHCNTEFTARTTVTKYCSDKCAKRAYKERIKTKKVERSNIETHTLKFKDLVSLKQKEYLTVKDASTLIGCSTKTVYRLIESGMIKASNLSERMTRIQKVSIDELLMFPKSEETKTEIVKQFSWALSECYTIGEIQVKFNISEKGLYDTIKRHRIPKRKNGKFTYVPKDLINNILN